MDNSSILPQHVLKCEGAGRHNMPPPLSLPMQRGGGGYVPSSPHHLPHHQHNVPQSPHSIPPSPHHVVPSPHHVAPSPHHINSPAAQSFHGNVGGAGVFQFSDAHIGMARNDKDCSLALSNNPQHSPMPGPHAGSHHSGAVQLHDAYSKACHVTSTPGQQQAGLEVSAQQQQGMAAYRTSSHPGGGDAMLSAINYSDTDMLHDSAFDVSGNNLTMDESLMNAASGGAGSANNDSAFDLFDSENSYPMDNQLSPQSFVDNTASFNLGR